MTKDEALQCAIEAIAAHGKTGLAVHWYRKWLNREIPTTVQYSLSCNMMDRAYELLKEFV